MALARFVLDVLEVLLSPQIVWAAALCLIVYWLREQLRSLLTRIAAFEFGSAKLLAPQQMPAPATEPDVPSEPAPEQTTLALSTPLGEAGIDEADRFFAALRLAEYWEFSYLNMFLVLSTQNVLDWIISFGPVPHAAFEAWWSGYIATREQRDVILQALQSHSLIEWQDDKLAATQKALRYQRFRGPRPPIAPLPVATNSAPVLPFPVGTPLGELLLKSQSTKKLEP